MLWRSTKKVQRIEKKIRQNVHFLKFDYKFNKNIKNNLRLSFIKKVFDDSYEVVVAHDGKDAIDVIGTAAAYNNLVCMLLDLNMPNINGFEVLDYLHENNLFAKLPVSIITGDDSKETVERAFGYPIIDVLQKPFNERDVKRVIEKKVDFSEKNKFKKYPFENLIFLSKWILFFYKNCWCKKITKNYCNKNDRLVKCKSN